MKHVLAFLKVTLLGGVLIVLPAWLAVMLIVKEAMHLQTEMAHPRVIAMVFIVVLCFLVGRAIQTTIGARAKRIEEERVLEKLPGTLRSFAGQLTEFEQASHFQPALIEVEDALVPGFFVEEHDGDRCTVFVPSVPTPMAGALYIIAKSRVHRLDLPATSVTECISEWGANSGVLVAALDQSKSIAKTTAV